MRKGQSVNVELLGGESCRAVVVDTESKFRLFEGGREYPQITVRYESGEEQSVHPRWVSPVEEVQS